MHGLDVLHRLNVDQVAREFAHAIHLGEDERANRIAEANPDLYVTTGLEDYAHLWMDHGENGGA